LDNISEQQNQNGAQPQKDPLFDIPDNKTHQKDDIFNDLFSDTKSSTPTSSKSSKVTTPLDKDDLFSSPKPLLKSVTSTEDESDDLFGTPTRKNKPVTDEVFSGSPAAVPGGIFGDKDEFDEVEDKLMSPDSENLFGVSSKSLSESTPEDDLFADPVRPPSLSKKSSKEEDDDDLFGAVKKTTKPKKERTMTKESDLFSDATDIFADLPAPSMKKSKSKEGKSLFGDNNDTDIFGGGGGASKKPAKKKSKKVKAEKADADIFDSQSPSIFDDPLNVLK